MTVLANLAKRVFVEADDMPPLTRICMILGGFSAMFMIATAIGRVCLGLSASAYRHLPLMTPAYIAVFMYLRQNLSNALFRLL